MTRRPYGHSRDVPIAEFLYRHEAELAAGFLDDAGIPFRLQVDDAGGADLGVTIARPAVLWVRAEDVDEARDLLELPEPPAAVPAQRGASRASPEPWREGEHRPARSDASTSGPLGRRERVVAAGLALALMVLAGAVRRGLAETPRLAAVLVLACLGVAAALCFAALLGRVLEPLRTWIRAVAGGAP